MAHCFIANAACVCQFVICLPNKPSKCTLIAEVVSVFVPKMHALWHFIVSFMSKAVAILRMDRIKIFDLKITIKYMSMST